MGCSAASRKALEDLWMERLLDAHLRYLTATAARANAERKCAKDSPRWLECRFAFGDALQAEDAACTEYQRVLNIFTDLTMRQKQPPEDLNKPRIKPARGQSAGVASKRRN